MRYRALFFPLILLVFVLLLVACGATESAPTLPPPPTLASSDLQPPDIVIVEGATVASDGSAKETAVADSSPTPIQTPTLSPTVTPTEAPEPVIDPAQMPAINNDLLFVNNGKLKRWQRDGQVVTLLDREVGGYTLSADGKQAVVSEFLATTEISNTVTAVTDTIKTYALNYIDIESGDVRNVVPAVNKHDLAPVYYKLSQDGRHLAFSTVGLGDPESLLLDEEVNAELYVMEIASGLPPTKVRDCAGACIGLVWHQDNNFFVFSDEAGLFMYNVAASEPELLVDGDDGSEFGLRFRPLSWSKNGRWLVMMYAEYIEGSSMAIFDVPTKQVMGIPNTFSYAGLYYPQLTWMADDRIFLTVTDHPEAGPVYGETYRINPDEGRVQLDEQVLLTTESMQPRVPMHWENGRFGYALEENNHPENGFYQRIAFNEPATRVFDFPDEVPGEIKWAPDGSGAVMQSRGAVSYGTVDGELVNLETAVGLRGHNFTWLP